MELNKKANIADDIFFLVMDKLSRKEYKKFVIDNPNGGTMNTNEGSELYYDIEGILEEYD